LEDKHLSF